MLIFNAVLKLWKSSVVDWKCFVIFIAVALASLITSLTPVLFVILSAVMGIAISCLEVKKK